MTERHTRKLAVPRKARHRYWHFYVRCAHWPFIRQNEGAPVPWHREHGPLLAAAFLLAGLVAFIIPAWASVLRSTPQASPHTVLPLALPKVSRVAPPRPIEIWHSVQVQPGQTLSDIFQRQGLSLNDLQRVIDHAGSAQSALHYIRPGEEFDFLLNSDGSLKGIRFDKDETSRMVMRFQGGKVTATVQAREVEKREHIAHGVIDSSLFAAGAKAGMNTAMVLQLANLFKYDIDFVQDLRQGDSFTVIYDDVYRDGAYLHEGNIIAAEFINQGRRYTAYRFKKRDGSYGWFSEDGRPVQKSFLRIPVDFTRISSIFSAARMHPILGRVRAHKGVDYAAPRGTPIHAAGDGVIRFRGWMHGYGNFVIIQHSKTISTAYGHMSRFAKEKVGQHVKQGQVIGYVGMTGLATGPHLHYEFRVNGVQRNPQTVTLPKPKPLPATQLARFKAEVVKPQLARLKAADTAFRFARLENTSLHNY